MADANDEKQLPPVPRIGEVKRVGEDKPTLGVAGWVLGSVLFTLPTLLLWGLHRLDIWPKPCVYYSIWLVMGIVLTVCVNVVANA